MSRYSNLNTYRPQPTKIYFEVVNDKTYCLEDNLPETTIRNLKEVLDYREDKNKITFVLPKERASYKSVVPRVQLCAFTAVNNYLRSLLGVELDHEDELWFACHPYVDKLGLPQKYTVTVLNDLVKPYGIGVSHIYVPKGTSLTEELISWQTFLGCNPIAKRNSQYSNKDYIQEISGGSAELIVQFHSTYADEFNFEYVETPHAPVVIFSDLGVNQQVSFAPGGGHSSYCSPRTKLSKDNWKLALKFDRIEKIKYKKVPPVNEVEPKLNTTLDIPNCLDKFNQRLAKALYTVNSYFGNYNQVLLNSGNTKIHGLENYWSYNPSFYRNTENEPTSCVNKDIKPATTPLNYKNQDFNQQEQRRANNWTRRLELNQTELNDLRTLLDTYKIKDVYNVNYQSDLELITLIHENLSLDIKNKEQIWEEVEEIIDRLAHAVNQEIANLDEIDLTCSLDKVLIDYLCDIVEDTVCSYKPISLLHILYMSSILENLALEKENKENNEKDKSKQGIVNAKEIIIPILIDIWYNDLAP